ncbi:uncharacterized protein LOC120014292 isoform X2 [Tripterygium wilfordii]|uniref:uncharacterized protein LOC120014292 isoform X2 n=1 Tax=Tripterygium wilfordii TaxID=458696 RepID=UPI0018F7F822|nr:uncharacterized protein LOC120014292 isoform X2 [Tripterygium wilfordii]
MARLVRTKSSTDWLSRLKSLTKIQGQRFCHTQPEGELQAPSNSEMDSESVANKGHIVDTSKWQTFKASRFGITHSRIPLHPLFVLRILLKEGFDSYLVGGCVRDLLLKKTPKDFDIITTAGLKKVKRLFNRAMIVGQRFPICIVPYKGSAVEVSSFETVALHAEGKEKFVLPQIPSGCNNKDILCWRNSMQRDFTINGLFFDPFADKIYDYVDGLADLNSLQLRTLVPAKLSFEEDCARILRGIRIAARLGLSLSKDTATAIRNLSSSVGMLAKSRIMLELNYMLSYGAAEPSICLLRRFKLLEIFLPFHAACLNQQTSEKYTASSLMLMKLFFNLDKLVTCDRPCDCRLWVGLLAFHLALVINPQNSFVIWVFASVLYHGKWKDGIKFAREHGVQPVKFVPEISGYSEIQSDEELAIRVSEVASLVQGSVDALTDSDRLLELMTRYPNFQGPGLVFVPKKIALAVSQIFDVLVEDVESYENGRESYAIDYHFLGKGNQSEMRSVLGRIVLETMSQGLLGRVKEVVEGEKNHLMSKAIEENSNSKLSDIVKNEVGSGKCYRQRHLPLNFVPNQETAKKQKFAGKCSPLPPEIASERQEMMLKEEEILLTRCLHDKATGKHNQDDKVEEKKLEKNDCDLLLEKMISEKTKKHKRVIVKERKSDPMLLSCLFR